ncbi:Pcc1-domain-containing protein [Cubamyces lactineus]|nr:Pcc1-domain-containing protein [Cubamyces lactineus]
MSASASAPSDSQWHTITIRIPFASEKHANIAKQVIDVDRELQPEVVKRTLAVEGNELVATFTTLTVRLARLTSNAFLENVDLVVRTIGEFGEDAERVPSSTR